MSFKILLISTIVYDIVSLIKSIRKNYMNNNFTNQHNIDIKHQSYWQKNINIQDAIQSTDLPRHAQIVFVGAGLSNLMCALHLQRAGWDAVIIDAQFAGAGCSARSGGMMLTGHSYSPKQLSTFVGTEKSERIYHEVAEAWDFIKHFIEHEKLAVDWQENGVFTGFSSSSEFESAKRTADSIAKASNQNVHIIEQNNIKDYVNSDLYKGGVFHDKAANIHPAKFTAGILRLCKKAGVKIVFPCRVENIRPNPLNSGKLVITDKGHIKADMVVSGTNGYSNEYSIYDRGFAMRLMPLYSMIIVTPEMDESQLRNLIPNNTAIVESSRRHCYYRPTPCGKRLMFGGRSSLLYKPREQVAQSLESMAEDIFQHHKKGLPPLQAEYTWLGKLAFTHAQTPYIQQVDDTHYRLGAYSGRGMLLAPYLGYQLSQIILQNQPHHQTVFTQTPHIPYPHLGGGWFIRPLNTYYTIKDYFRGRVKS